MQDINDDMDDLFRKAAEQYPLKTDGADWQKVLAGLQDAAMPAAEEKEKNKRRALWLFWLLPLALILGAVYYKSDNQPAKQIALNKESATDKSGNEASQKNNAEHGNSASSSITGNGNNATSTLSSGEINKKQKSSAKANDNMPSTNTTNRRTADAYTVSGVNNSAIRSASLKNKNGFDYTQPGTTSNDGMMSDEKKNFSLQQPVASFNRIDKKETQDNSVLKAGGTLQNSGNDLVLNDVKANKDSGNVKADNALNLTKTDSVANNNASAENKSKMIKAKPRKQTGFYAGLMASFDVSTVKLQRINKTGYGFEALLGYRFSNRLSVESGVNWTDKQYYSVGKYFDKTKTGIPAESKIINTNGSCAMFEIPVAVKYDFWQKKNSNFFATAGLSSYIMKAEKYTYLANHSGNYYTATKKYSNSGSNLFSVASLSLGYQLQVNKHLSLRAEPYIKMPLRGVGIAKMPITSTGISVGFTRSF